MKIFLIIGCILLSTFSLPCKKNIFMVDIFDSNYSMSYTLHYHITKDSLTIIKLNGLQNANTIHLMKKKLSIVERDRILKVIKSPSFKSLKHQYKNSLIEDGDRKRIVIQLDNQKKTIEIANVYNKEIASLINSINTVLDEKYKIRYLKK